MDVQPQGIADNPWCWYSAGKFRVSAFLVVVFIVTLKSWENERVDVVENRVRTI